MEMRDPPEGATLLRVIKTPVWKESQKLAEESGCPLKVGDKTWTTSWDYSSNTHLEGNKWGINFDKSCFEVITEEEFKKISNEELSDEELLEIAKEKYHVGTVYYALDSDGNTSVLAESEVIHKNPQMLSSGIDAGPGYIYSKATKQWAEIVTPAKFEKYQLYSDEELLKIAAAKYPVGTKYKALYAYGGAESSYSVSIRQPEFHQEKTLIDVGVLYCYHRETNTWAEVIKDEEPVEIKQELPESGLLVSKRGSIIYRIEGSEGFGFNPEKYGMSNSWSFISEPEHWRKATPEDEAKFLKLLKAEADKLNLGVDAKIKGHADGMKRNLNNGTNTPIFHLSSAWNKNGQIFHNGIWAQPLDETQPAPSPPEPQRTSEKEVKPRYRIKTKEEFERDGNMVGGYPKGWNRGGEMDAYYGQILPKSCCLENIRFIFDGWEFNTEHDIVKVSEYPLTPTEALGKTSTLGDISYQRDIEIEKVKKENVKRDFTPMKNIV